MDNFNKILKKFENLFICLNDSVFLSFNVLNEKETQICFKILKKGKIWKKIYSFKEMKKLKENMGFEGDWTNFFESLKSAFEKTTNFILKDVDKVQEEDEENYNDEDDQISTKSLILIIYHCLSEDIKIKSEYLFDENPIGSSDKDFVNEIHSFIGELYSYSVNLKKLAKDNCNGNTNTNGQSSHNKNEKNVHLTYNNSGNKNGNYNIGSANSSQTKLVINKPTKRKFNSNLINPNAKKRKEKGTKFISEDETNNNNE